MPEGGPCGAPEAGSSRSKQVQRSVKRTPSYDQLLPDANFRWNHLQRVQLLEHVNGDIGVSTR